MSFIQANTLDGLLNDLELVCQDSEQLGPAEGSGQSSGPSLKSPTSLLPSSHLDRSTTSDRNLGGQILPEDGITLTKGVNSLSRTKISPPPVPQRDLSSVMATTAIKDNSRVANNLNELDVLLQDLSNARYVPTYCV